MKKFILFVTLLNIVLFSSANSDYEIKLISSSTSSLKIEFILKISTCKRLPTMVLCTKKLMLRVLFLFYKRLSDLLKFTSNIHLLNQGVFSFVLESDTQI